MRRKTAYYSLGLLIGLVIMVIAQIPSQKTRMVLCNVGQGEAILISRGSNQVLIDGGPSSSKVLDCLSRQIPFWDRNIELIVLTNTDFDHLNGLSTVLLRYSNTAFVTADGVHESEALSRFRAAIRETGTEIELVEQGQEIRVGSKDQLTFRVLWPPEVDPKYLAVFSEQISESNRSQILGESAKRGDLNERSVVLLLDDNGYKVLLTGDAGDQAETEMLETGILFDIDLLKVGHHGSKYASSLEFLERVKPELAVISVGAKNRYGHPTPETLERLKQAGAEIRRTDEMGELVIELPN